MFRIERLDHMAFTARDIDGLAEWYAKVFGMERVYADAWGGLGDPIALCAGDACVALFRERRISRRTGRSKQTLRHGA